MARARRPRLWIRKAIRKPGALRRELGIKPGQKIPVSRLRAIKARLQRKAEGRKKLTPRERRTLRRVILALTLRRLRRRK